MHAWMHVRCIPSLFPAVSCPSLAGLQSTVKHQLSAEEAKAQAAELVRKARIKREKEEAELARIREREVSHLQRLWRPTQHSTATARHGRNISAPCQHF